MLFCLLLAGCFGHTAGNRLAEVRTDVFGIALFSAEDIRELGGVRGEDEPCLRGYERSFEQLGVTVGYGFDGRIRKIATRNPGTAIGGVRPGDMAAVGRDRLLQTGFRPTDSPNRFRTGCCSLGLLVDSDGRIFGLTLEAVE